MTTFALIHGGGGSAWEWCCLEPELRTRGYEAVSMDLPSEDPAAGWEAYTEAVLTAIGDRTDVVLVAHSLGGFVAPLVCARRPVDLLVLVSAMVPVAGETVGQWWERTGYAAEEAADLSTEADQIAAFLHDVEPGLAAEALRRSRPVHAAAMEEPWPLPGWPAVPTRFILCTQDRFFRPAFTRRMLKDRLGVAPDVIDSGHAPHLSRPAELADRLVQYVAEARSAAPDAPGAGRGRLDAVAPGPAVPGQHDAGGDTG